MMCLIFLVLQPMYSLKLRETLSHFPFRYLQLIGIRVVFLFSRANPALT